MRRAKIISGNILSKVHAILIGDNSDFENNAKASGNEESSGESNTGGGSNTNGKGVENGNSDENAEKRSNKKTNVGAQKFQQRNRAAGVKNFAKEDYMVRYVSQMAESFSTVLTEMTQGREDTGINDSLPVCIAETVKKEMKASMADLKAFIHTIFSTTDDN